MSDDVEELKRRHEEHIGAMIHFPIGPVIEERKNTLRKYLYAVNTVHIIYGNVFLIP